ncbi:MAG: hypothetical protein HY913_10795 [Desulfomonile tiedjei]|nr:hypothetical protein [Desulfomonile tiedjei]
MKLIDRNAMVKALVKSLLTLVLICAVGVAPCSAQSHAAALGSYLPIAGLERFIGPIIPACGIGSTFRSEVSAGMGVGDVRGAKLTGSSIGEISLRRSLLDEAPLRLEVLTNLRLWRFGFRAAYTNFETRAKHVNLGRVDFTGLTLGGDVDVVQFPWLSAGACVDFYLYDPSFQGPIFNPDNSTETLQIVGRKPSTIGAYLRYIPPEILGYPLHLEAWYKAPLGGSKFTAYGAALVFRPQIYRFDVAAKLALEREHLKFSAEPRTQFPVLLFPDQKWEIDMEWNLFTVDVAIYF